MESPVLAVKIFQGYLCGMQKERKAKNFLPKASYPGGPSALKQFIASHLKYPEEAKKHNIEGTVVLRVDIDYKGKVIASRVKSSLGYGCDEEAQRVVGLLQFEVNSKVRKGKILFHKNMNIHFKMSKKPRVQTQLAYRITKKQETENPSASGSYHYTITI